MSSRDLSDLKNIIMNPPKHQKKEDVEIKEESSS